MAIEYNAHIVQDGLVLCLDAASKASYPGTGTLWNDLAGSSNGTLINDATFSGANEGVIVRLMELMTMLIAETVLV
jgi:hypothetical protein